MYPNAVRRPFWPGYWYDTMRTVTPSSFRTRTSPAYLMILLYGSTDTPRLNHSLHPFIELGQKLTFAPPALLRGHVFTACLTGGDAAQ